MPFDVFFWQWHGIARQRRLQAVAIKRVLPFRHDNRGLGPSTDRLGPFSEQFEIRLLYRVKFPCFNK